MKGYEQYGNKGNIVNDDYKIEGDYITIGYNQLYVKLNRYGEWRCTWNKFEQLLEEYGLHAEPEHN